MIKVLNRKYKNVTVEYIVRYLRLRETMSEKNKYILKKKIVFNSLNKFTKTNYPCQFYSIDMQSNVGRDMKYMLVYRSLSVRSSSKICYSPIFLL